jgi:putative copper resistance protein D
VLVAVALTAAVVAAATAAGVAWARSGSPGSGLPVTWCRWRPGDPVLPALYGWRFVTLWQLDAVALVSLTPVAGAYAWGVHRVRRRHPGRPWPWRRSLAFAAGLGVVVLSTCSSIGVYDMTLFSMHMTQHLALIMVAPPLLVAGQPLTLALHATRNPWHGRIKRAARSRVTSALTFPGVVFVVYAGTVVGTHLTGAMDAVMTRPWLGQAEHLLYLVAGYLFFVVAFGEEPLRWRLSMPGRFLLVVLSMAVDTFVGVVLMQTSQPIAMLPHPGWGSSALVDTQTGGAIMWFFGDGLMAVLLMLLSAAWARKPERARRTGRSWFELTRQATLHERTGYGTGGAAPVRGGRAELDEDEQALAAYNAWLARLAGGPHSEDAPGG